MLYGDGIHDDTLAIQELLDGCGIVTIQKPGTYLITKTLIIHSNTRFELSPGATLLAAPMSLCSLLQNEHFAGGGRDENIEIIGGTWDGNCDAMGLDNLEFFNHRNDEPYDPARFTGKLIRFAHIDRLVLQRMVVRNPVSYGIQIADANGFVVRDIYFDFNWHFCTTDGVHVNGPSRNGCIENLAGTTNDDMVGLTTYDERHGEVTLGDIENIYLHNLTAKNGYSGVRLMCGENCVMRNIHIDGLYGTYRYHGVVISNHSKRPGSVMFDQITIENVDACKSDEVLDEKCFTKGEATRDKLAFFFFGRGGTRCGNVTFRNIRRHQTYSTESALFKFLGTCEIDRLVLDNVYQTTAEGVTAPLWENEGATIHELIERDCIKLHD